MIPLAVPNLTGNEARYLAQCVETTFVSSVGPFVDRFEQEVARASGGTHGVAVSSGTTGLHVALVALGVGRDDLVILPSLTFIASANAVAHCGATPWLFDVGEDSWTLDPQALGRGLEQETERRDGAVFHRDSGRRVAAIMPVYTLGLPADMDAIGETARRFGLPIVADGAAALGARYRGREIAALGADLSVFSFNGNKTVTAGGGGAVVGNDAVLCDRVKHLSTTARAGADYDHDAVGFNYRMTNLQAAVGCAQLERLEEFVAAKRRIAKTYDVELGSLPGVRTFPAPEWGESACWFSGIVLEDREASEAVNAMREHGIGCRPFWKPIHRQRPYADAPVFEIEVCERIHSRILTLPCSTNLTDDEQQQVIAQLREWIAQP
ncbi:MAG: aminotransferase class I/II-fold pyridoxal phosphate-dependent enzyme [bacterium]|nr:aminotransferase class I/II-fold pyridoxal phosphate-dependent enzyme [bacterium]